MSNQAIKFNAKGVPRRSKSARDSLCSISRDRVNYSIKNSMPFFQEVNSQFLKSKKQGQLQMLGLLDLFFSKIDACCVLDRKRACLTDSVLENVYSSVIYANFLG